MIVFEQKISEIPYGRTKRAYLYDIFQNSLPQWLSLGGTPTVNDDDNLVVAPLSGQDVSITSKLFNIVNIDAMRFSLNNFRKTNHNVKLYFQILSEDGLIKLEYRSQTGGVGLYLNDVLIETVPKLAFNGVEIYIGKPRKLSVHYCPQSGYVSFMENDWEAHHFKLQERLDMTKKYKFQVLAGSPIITSQIQIINWLSY